jgi:hypothetical protein
MFSFCPHCGGSIDQEQRQGQAVVCIHCGKPIGTVAAAAAPVMVDRSEELIRQGVAAPCPLCRQLVELKGRSFAPHFQAGARKLCAQSGKPVGAGSACAGTESARPAASPAGGKDLSVVMTREAIRVVSCRRGAEPQIDELTLEFLDKNDRVRVQIEALRDMLGADFRLREYPAALGQPGLAVWGGAAACVVGKAHERGGYQTMSDTEIAAVVADLRGRAELFFA